MVLDLFFGIICLICKVFGFTKLNDLRKPMRCLYEKILVVDDERPISDIIKFNLTKEGYEVVTAFDGREALEQFEAKKPDLVILDLMLPELDGLEIAKEIRKTSHTPIIMLSAKDSEFDKVIGLEIGADDYVTKPFSNRELLARIKAHLRRTETIELQ